MNDRNGEPITDSAENRRLEEQIAHLESERKKDQQHIAELTAERDQYLRTILDWHAAQFSEDQLRQWATEQNMQGYTFASRLCIPKPSAPSFGA